MIAEYIVLIMWTTLINIIASYVMSCMITKHIESCSVKKAHVSDKTDSLYAKSYQFVFIICDYIAFELRTLYSKIQ